MPTVEGAVAAPAGSGVVDTPNRAGRLSQQAPPAAADAMEPLVAEFTRARRIAAAARSPPLTIASATTAITAMRSRPVVGVAACSTAWCFRLRRCSGDRFIYCL